MFTWKGSFTMTQSLMTGMFLDGAKVHPQAAPTVLRGSGESRGRSPTPAPRLPCPSQKVPAATGTDFGADGGLLETFDSREERRNSFQATVDAGVKLNVRGRHIDARVYGNSTAVATSYGVGTVTQPNGTTNQTNQRITTVLIKQGGQWKVVHRHLSPVRLPQ